MNLNYLIVGAGFSGAVCARELAEAGHSVTVIDERAHIAGNCHTQRDASTGVMEHVYGPHIFNTSNPVVWEYVNRHAVMMPFVNRVKASHDKGIFSMPINLHTINQFFGKRMSPDEARAFIESKADKSIVDPQNFEEQAIRFIGRELYEAFFKGYTIKQWGVHPTELPASILKRLPVRFNYDDNYYNTKWQGIPQDGYSAMIASILDHPQITVKLETAYDTDMRAGYDHLIYTGPLDRYFGYSAGRLGYRTVYWHKEEHTGDFQGNAVINYPSEDVAFTRIHEHKHFAPWESHDKTLVFTEYSKETAQEDVPYYPKRLEADKQLLGQYRAMAEQETGVSFLGRLATYRYMDMHHVIGEALDFSRNMLAAVAQHVSPPVFPNQEETSLS